MRCSRPALVFVLCCVDEEGTGALSCDFGEGASFFANLAANLAWRSASFGASSARFSSGRDSSHMRAYCARFCCSGKGSSGTSGV